jgi:hypothetical protein
MYLEEEPTLNEWVEFNDAIMIKWLEDGTTVIVHPMREPYTEFWCWAAIDENGTIWDYRPTQSDEPSALSNRQRAMDSADKHLSALVA